uniref:Uncharacterized protein n=1 Tax=Octopus bimaculoides TaxID=37653 RepID=A0A0L8GC78_OCTBM
MQYKLLFFCLKYHRLCRMIFQISVFAYAVNIHATDQSAFLLICALYMHTFFVKQCRISVAV